MNSEAFALDPNTGHIHTSQEDIDHATRAIAANTGQLQGLIALTESQAVILESVAPSRRAPAARRLITEAAALVKAEAAAATETPEPAKPAPKAKAKRRK